MMLAAPPAAAITYVNESRGLDPSVYGGGGSPSSTPLFDDSPLVSVGSAALFSAAALCSASSSARASSKEGAGAVASSELQTVSVTLARMQSNSASVGKYNEEKGGGRGEGGIDDEASDVGGCRAGAGQILSSVGVQSPSRVENAVLGKQRQVGSKCYLAEAAFDGNCIWLGEVGPKKRVA